MTTKKITPSPRKVARDMLEQFLEEVSDASEHFEWLDSCGMIRAYQDGTRFCPITAVAFVSTGIYYTVSEWEQAAKVLNLPHELAISIMAAADGTYGEQDLREALREKIQPQIVA